jgi:hypothetical protein
VGVSEHRKAVRPEFDAFGDGVETRVHRLQRKSVEQVEIDPSDAGPAQPLDGTCGLKLCSRLMARCTAGSKLWTPKLARLTPQ